MYVASIFYTKQHSERMNKMKKAARLISAIALTLTIIICFSGCGLVDLTRSLVNTDNYETTKGSSDNKTTSADNDMTEYSEGDVTINVTVTPSSTDTSNTTATDPSTTQPATTKPNTTTNNSSGNAGSGNTNNTTNKNEPTTAKPNTNIEEEPVKDVQDLLFATDPNTASKILTTAGFAYDEEQGIYYTPLYPWQRYFGYNVGFDMAAPLAGMIFDTKRIEFEYKGKEWMIQLWKGQYGITAGAEIGLYNRDPEKVMQYDCADDEDLIEMQFDFYNQGKYVFSRGPEKHWWLTGFKVFHMGIPFTITLDMTLKFTDNEMATAFMQSLKQQQHTDFLNPIKYKRTGSTIRVIWGSIPDGVKL